MLIDIPPNYLSLRLESFFSFYYITYTQLSLWFRKNYSLAYIFHAQFEIVLFNLTSSQVTSVVLTSLVKYCCRYLYSVYELLFSSLTWVVSKIKKGSQAGQCLACLEKGLTSKQLYLQIVLKQMKSSLSTGLMRIL